MHFLVGENIQELGVTELEIEVGVEDRPGDQEHGEPEEEGLFLAQIMFPGPENADNSEDHCDPGIAVLPAEILGVERYVVFEVVEILSTRSLTEATTDLPVAMAQTCLGRSTVGAAVLFAADNRPEGLEVFRLAFVDRRVKSGADEEEEMDAEAEEEEPQGHSEKGQGFLSPGPEDRGNGDEEAEEHGRPAIHVFIKAENYI